MLCVARWASARRAHKSPGQPLLRLPLRVPALRVLRLVRRPYLPSADVPCARSARSATACDASARAVGAPMAAAHQPRTLARREAAVGRRLALILAALKMAQNRFLPAWASNCALTRRLADSGASQARQEALLAA